MIKVMSVFGTRPEAHKMAPIVQELERHPHKITSRVCVTAQHREMLDQALNLFQIEPDYDLDIMEKSQSLSHTAAMILEKLDGILQAERPDWVLVQGDTTTVMAAAIAAFYRQVKVGHVEAGLRTFNKFEPFPEEINRRIAGVIADKHFAPTEQSRRNLLNEGISPATILVTGNPGIDALQIVSQMPYDSSRDPLAKVSCEKRVILITAHRRENFGEPLEQICLALKDIAVQHADDVQLIYPVHLNPRVQEPVYRLLSGISNITLMPPLDYFPLVQALKRCYLVLTDSGGIQEEAPGLGKPVLVLRDVTERPEAVEAGTVRLVGANRAHIVEWIERLLTDPVEYARMARAINPYGDGQAAHRIVEALLA